MTATTVPYLRLTDGTTTLNLLDGTNYALERGSWAPRVAVRRLSTLGGRPYTSVVEEIPLIVRGSTAAVALANLGALSKMLDQAEAWDNDESVDPVVVEYQPQGSTLAEPLQSLILGRGDSSILDLPVVFNDVGMLYEISGVVLRFLRDGAWYGDEEDVETEPPGLATGQPRVQEATFADAAAHLSPVTVVLRSMSDRDDIGAYDAGFLLVASAAERLYVVDGPDLDAGGDFSTDADATRQPEGAGVLIYTPSGTAEVESGNGTILLSAGKRVGVVAALRNTSATTTFTVRVLISGPNGRNAATSRPYYVDASTTDPRIVLLGVVLCEDSIYTIITVKVQASAAADTLVIDYLALVVLDDPTSRIVAVGPIDLAQYINPGDTTELWFDPRALTSHSPLVQHVDPNVPETYYATPEYVRGDAFLLTRGETIAAMYCGRNAGSAYWRMYDTGAAAPLEVPFSFIRRRTYLTPQ